MYAVQGLLYSAPLLAGDDGTAQTIDKIRSLVDDAWKDSYVNRFAIEIVRTSGVAPYDNGGQIRAIYDWVRTNFYFVNDPVSKEALRPTRDLIEMRAGDCDDINAIVLPSLLGTIGYECRLVTIAADRRDPDAFSHIYAEVAFGGDWIPIDAARPGAQFGVEPPTYFRREWWSLVQNDHGEYLGAGQVDSPLLGALMLPPQARPALGLAGYGESFGGDFSPANASATTAGQPVQQAITGAIGPGGCAIASAASVAGGCGCDPSSGVSAFAALALVIGGLLLIGGGK